MSVMHFFKKAQPALLYLSPACVSAVVLTAWLRGELKEAWEWKDGEEDKEDEKEKNSRDDKALFDNNGRPRSGEGSDVKEVNGDGFEDEEEDSITQVRTRKTSARRRSSRKNTK